MRREIVFVHIPKTGGTSIRNSLELALKNHLILRDYGDHPTTSPELRTLQAANGIVQRFRERVGTRGNLLLSGHFPAFRYWNDFNAESFITILRNPIDRVLSSYASWKRQGLWDGTFEEFLALPSMDRRMCEYLSRIDLAAFGFIGFLEEFEASLVGLSEFVGARVKWRKLNQGDYDLDVTLEAARAMIAAKRMPDVRLYENLRKVRSGNFFAPAVAAVRRSYLGEVQLEGEMIAGWLSNLAKEFIAEVEVLRDDKCIAVVNADRYVETAKTRGHSRSGVCGFRVPLRRLAVAPGQSLTFRARNSDFELKGSPLCV
jgi:hypothetical protein